MLYKLNNDFKINNHRNEITQFLNHMRIKVYGKPSGVIRPK
jgi:hypothetical protein